MDGIVNVMKPAGMTSHDVVARLRRVYHTKKVGHTGTLDPDAIGVLPICVGQATRLVEYFTEKDKSYKVILKFGQETDTQDASGEITIETDLPDLSKAEFCNVTEQFVGEIQQIPPMYSAIKKDGRPLYKFAREGIEVVIEPRSVTIHSIKVLMYNKESAMLEVHCGKGTYIRTLCQDLGRACGSSAHMTYLMRLSSGIFHIADAIPLERLEQSDAPEQFLQNMNDCLYTMPEVVITDAKMQERIVNGLSQKAPGADILPEGTVCRATSVDGALLAIGAITNQAFQPNKVFKCGE